MAEITIKTARFGDIQVDDSRIITFIAPILGFEGLLKFILLDHGEDSPFKWLQSTDNGDLAFVVTNPKLFGIDYEFILPQEVEDQLEVKAAEDLIVLTIVNVPQEDPAKMTANLLGPLVVHQETRKAMQVVLNDTVTYSTKIRLIPDEVLDQGACPVASGKGDASDASPDA
jgi:flagellar assembly factor FliW